VIDDSRRSERAEGGERAGRDFEVPSRKKNRNN